MTFFGRGRARSRESTLVPGAFEVSDFQHRSNLAANYIVPNGAASLGRGRGKKLFNELLKFNLTTQQAANLKNFNLQCGHFDNDSESDSNSIQVDSTFVAEVSVDEPETEKEPCDKRCSKDLVKQKKLTRIRRPYYHIDKWPNELLVKLFQYLDIKTRMRAHCVCQRWRLLLSSSKVMPRRCIEKLEFKYEEKCAEAFKLNVFNDLKKDKIVQRFEYILPNCSANSFLPLLDRQLRSLQPKEVVFRGLNCSDDLLRIVSRRNGKYTSTLRFVYCIMTYLTSNRMFRTGKKLTCLTALVIDNCINIQAISDWVLSPFLRADIKNKQTYLKRLELVCRHNEYVQVTDASLELLAQHISALDFLKLKNCPFVTAKGLRSLLNAFWYKGRKRLLVWLENTGFDQSEFTHKYSYFYINKIGFRTRFVRDDVIIWDVRSF